MTPTVSVVMPVRDAGATLGACLRSIEAQTLRSWELVAIDDGSRDATRGILEAAARRDPRVRLARPGHIGLVAALNLGLEAARAALVARMDADDLMHPRRLELQRRHLREHPDQAVVGSRVELFPAEAIGAGYREYVRWQNDCMTPEEIAANLYVESPLAHPSVMIRRDAVLAAGGYRDGPFPEDYELWLRLHERGHRLGKRPETLLRWRESAGRTSRTDPRYEREAFDRLRAEYLARDPRLHGRRAVVVWGAGRRTRLRVRHLVERGIEPSAWIDIDPRKIGGRLRGIPIHPPEWLAGRPRPVVLVYVANHGAREQIAARLDALGYRIGEDWLAVG